MNTLEKILQSTKERIKAQQNIIDFNAMRAKAESNAKATKEFHFAFEKAIKKKGLNFICEVKKASPSKGVIVEDFSPTQIAIEYQNALASAVSCLTEPYYFLGKDEYLQEIKKHIDLPVLRKDFIINEYMIYQAKAIESDAILLIAAALSKEQIRDYCCIADSLGLSVLVEVHNENEINDALFANARVIGVNNRNLKTFEVDINTSLRLRKLVPSDIVFVSESGIEKREDIIALENHSINAVLIGERLMRESNKLQALKELRGY